MPLLRNHIAAVTGAASGIGRAIALGYAREGAQVTLLDQNEKAAAEAAQEIRDTGGQAESFALDVTRREDCIAVAKRIAEQVGQGGRTILAPLPEDDPRQRRPDISLATRLLDWKPTIALDQGLKRCIAYFEQVLRASA